MSRSLVLLPPLADPIAKLWQVLLDARLPVQWTLMVAGEFSAVICGEVSAGATPG